MNIEKTKQVLKMISEDMEKDAKKMEGAPFNGRNVATAFGQQGAAIAALANIVKTLLEEKQVDGCRG